MKSKIHHLGSYELKKVSLSCFDDKRYTTKHRKKLFKKNLLYKYIF